MSNTDLSNYETHREWYACAPMVWKVLAAGYVWLLFSILIDWKVTSAGGLLAGACIVAEIFFLDSPLQNTIDYTKKDTHYDVRLQQDRLQFFTNYDDSFKRAKIREENGSERTVSINTNIGVWVFSRDVRGSLYNIATRSEKESVYRRVSAAGKTTEALGWAHHLTSSRAKRKINIIIAVSAALGTFVWAYFPSICECA